jgi:peroxiredoxin
MQQLAAGSAAPVFALETLSGRVFRLSDAIADGPLVLVFYKASCPTCQLTFPFLQRIHAENPSGMRIVGISQDDAAETKEFVGRFGIGFEIALDKHPFEVSSSYELEFVPAVFVVGRDGRIQLSEYGFSKETLNVIAKPLELFRGDDGLPATRPG